MAFADAVFDGMARLDGLTALRVDTSAELRDALAARKVVPVTVVPFSPTLEATGRLRALRASSCDRDTCHKFRERKTGWGKPCLKGSPVWGFF
jgi:hypothetical protein